MDGAKDRGGRVGRRLAALVLAVAALAVGGCDEEGLFQLYCHGGKDTFQFGGRTYDCESLKGRSPALTTIYGHSSGFMGAGNEAAFSAGGVPSSQAERIVRWEWDLDFDGSFDDAVTLPDPANPSESAYLYVVFDELGEHFLAVRAVDDRGENARAHTNVRVYPPDRAEAFAAFSASPNPDGSGAPVSFDASGSTTSDGPFEFRFHEGARRYWWDYDGDGVFDEVTDTPQVSHTYPAGPARDYLVRLGYRGTEPWKPAAYTTRTVTVPGSEPPPDPPTPPDPPPPPPPDPDPPCDPCRREASVGSANLTLRKPRARPFSGHLFAAPFPDRGGELEQTDQGVRIPSWVGLVDLDGKLLRGKRGRGARPPIAALLDSSWLAQASTTLRDDGTLTLEGWALASSAKLSGEACLRFKLTSYADRPGKGKIKTLSGSGELRTYGGVAKFGFRPMVGGGASVKGTLRPANSEPKPPPARCQELEQLTG